VFFHDGRSYDSGNGRKPAMSPGGKQALLDAVRNEWDLWACMRRATRFHTPPDTPDLANRYIAHGESKILPEDGRRRVHQYTDVSRGCRTRI